MAIPWERVVEEDLNIGTGTVEVSMPAGGKLTGHQLNRHTFYEFNVRRYGAVGDGVTDDTTAVKRAIADALFLTATSAFWNAVVYFPAGTYRLVGEIDALGANRVHFVGENPKASVLQWDDDATKGLVIDTVSNASVSSALAVDSTIGKYTVQVQAGAGATFTAGAWAYLEDGNSLHGSFISRILSISTDTITLEEAVPVDFLVANTATLYSYVQYPLLEGVRVKGLGFTCVKGTSTVNKLTLLFLSRLNAPLVTDCYFDASTGPLITTRALKNGVIENSHFRNALTTAGSGIEAQTSTGLVIRNCSSTRCTFGFIVARSPRSKVEGCNATACGDRGGRCFKPSGGSNFSVFTGNTASDCGYTGIRVENSAYVSVTGNTFFAGSSQQSGAGMIELAGDPTLSHHHTVTGNTIVGGLVPAGFSGAAGIAFTYDTDGVETNNVVSGNNISSCPSYGIYIKGNRNIIVGNRVGSGISNAAILFVTPNNGYCIIDDNVFVTEGGAVNSPAIYTSTSLGGNLIGLNKHTATLSLHASDTVASTTTSKRPVQKTSTVSTGANLTETTAWDITITGGTFAADDDSFQLTAELSLANNANAKTIKVYLGTTVVTFALTGADATATNLKLVVDGTFGSSGGGFLYAVHTLVGRSNTAPVVLSFGGGSGDDWSQDQHIKITLTNGVATASDITFNLGKLVFQGVNITPTAAS